MFELIVIIWICLLVSVMVILCYVCRKNYRRLNLLKDTLTGLTNNRIIHSELLDKELKILRGEVTSIENDLYIEVESDNVNQFRERVSFGHILGALMDKLGYTVKKGALAVKKVEEKK